MRDESDAKCCLVMRDKDKAYKGQHAGFTAEAAAQEVEITVHQMATRGSEESF